VALNLEVDSGSQEFRKLSHKQIKKATKLMQNEFSKNIGPGAKRKELQKRMTEKFEN
jgi:hypothetical protein